MGTRTVRRGTATALAGLLLFVISGFVWASPWAATDHVLFALVGLLGPVLIVTGLVVVIVGLWRGR